MLKPSEQFFNILNKVIFDFQINQQNFPRQNVWGILKWSNIYNWEKKKKYIE